MESSCRESRPWTTSNYDKNVSLCLFLLGWAKQPFLADLQSQPGLCQADGLVSWVGPGKPNLPLGLRGKAGGCYPLQWVASLELPLWLRW